MGHFKDNVHRMGSFPTVEENSVCLAVM